MGLGLSIAYNLIKMMDGEVAVESELGRGSTFVIRVFLEKYQPDKAPLFDSGIILEPRSYDLKGCHVLIAEDNELNRIILGALLSNEGLTFEEARDGQEALDLFENTPSGTFDCILMDMRMPRLDGIRATMMIRDSKKADAKSIPIIGVSANGFADDIRQAKLAGVNDYATKPIDRDKLLEAMGRLIEKK